MQRLEGLPAHQALAYVCKCVLHVPTETLAHTRACICHVTRAHPGQSVCVHVCARACASQLKQTQAFHPQSPRHTTNRGAGGVPLRQEIDGSQAGQLELVPCGQTLQNSRSQRGGWALPR